MIGKNNETGSYFLNCRNYSYKILLTKNELPQDHSGDGSGK